MKHLQFILIACLWLSVGSLAAQKSKSAKVSHPKITTEAQARFDYYYFEAQRLKLLEQPDAQLDALRMCMEIDSTNAAVQFDLGTLYVHLNRVAEGRQLLKNAVETEPTNWWYRIQYISVLATSEQYETAIEQTEELRRIFPKRDEVYTALSSLYRQAGEFDKAIDALNQLEVYTGVNQYLSLEKFELYSLLNKEKKAIDEIRRLAQKYPQEIRYRILLADIYLDKKQAKKAFEIYQQVLKEDPNNPFVYVSLSNYYKLQKEPAKAMDAIYSALKNPKLPAETKMDILAQYVDQLLADSKKIDETEELFQMLIEMYPLNEMPHAYYAHFLMNQKRPDEALDELESVININPKNVGAWKTTLQILGEREDTVGILSLTERALEELLEVPEFYFYRSMAYYQQGDLDKALEVNQLAVQNLSNSVSGLVLSNFYGQVGDIYHQQGNEEKSFESYEKALELNPHNIYVMNNYAYFLSEKDMDLRKAERLSAKTVEAEPNNSTYLDTYAWIFFKQGNYMLARIYIDRAVENMKEDEVSDVLYEHSGDIHAALGNNEKALEMWQKALELKEDKAELQEKIDNLKMRK